MRLVNADILLEALNGFGDKEHGNRHFLYGIESAKEIITNAPTIEAIPVEWITKWLAKQTIPATSYGIDYSAVEMILDDWEKENEAD